MNKILPSLIIALSFAVNAFATVNINTATQAELESLQGVGPVRAQAIIEYRKKNGSFKSVDDLEKVNGVGAVTLSEIRKDVSITGKTTVRPAIKAEKPEHSTKDTKSVGNEKAATSGKKADTKEVKAEKPAKEKAKKEVVATKSAKTENKKEKETAAETLKANKKATLDAKKADKK